MTHPEDTTTAGPLALSLHAGLGPEPSKAEDWCADLNAARERGHAAGLAAAEAERERTQNKAALWLLATVCLWA